MSDAPVSATQLRVCKLFGFQEPQTYAHAAAILTAAGLPADGVPAGETWRSVKKLTDEQLRAALPQPQAAEPVNWPTGEERRLAAIERRRQYEERRAARERLNAQLKAAGYRWRKVVPVDADTDGLPGGDEEWEWVLLDPAGNETTLAAAKAALGI